MQFKNYSVIVTEKLTKKTLLDILESAKSVAFLQKKYRAKFFHHPTPVQIKVERRRKKPGVQTSILDFSE